jgi:phosphotransferase system  glucose/maltose/N-acetylglucosamine-specific IIC component
MRKYLKFFGDIARRYITSFLLLIATTPNTTLTWPRNQNGAEDIIHIKCVAHVREMVQKERICTLI